MKDVSFCGAGEVAALVDFIDSEWRPGHVFARDPDFLRWHYDGRRVRGCDPHGLSVLLARESGRIVGMLGLNEVGFTALGTPGTAVWTSLWYASPKARGRAVGARLWQPVTRAGYDAICMMGMNPAVRPFFEALRFEILRDTPRWCGVLDRAGAAALLRENPAASPAAVERAVAAAAVHPDTEADAGAAFELLDWGREAASGWQEVWRRHVSPRLIGTAKDASYVEWRYATHPRYRYRITFARDAGGRGALAVTRTERLRDRPETVLRVLELLGDAEAAYAALRREVCHAREEGALFADFFAVRPGFAAPAERAGFARVQGVEAGDLFPYRFQPLEFGSRTVTTAFRASPELRRSVGPLLGREELYVSPADADQDRPS